MKLFRNLFFIITLLFSFTIFAFNPGKDSQFIGSNVVDSPTGKDSLKIDHPDKAIILIYNQGWGISNTKSKYVRGKDPCFVNFYLDNQKKYTPGFLGPWYSLASEFNEIIKDKKIYLYYYCKNRAQDGFDADTLRALQAGNLVKLVDAFVREGVPRKQIIPVGHSGGATVVIEAIFKKPKKIASVIATSWTVSGQKPWKAKDSQEIKRFAARYKKNTDPLNALVYACDQDEFTSYEDQAFWNEVSGVDFVKLAGNHVCWFNLFNSKHEILRVIKFIQSNLD